jgi:hypothetical protein
VTTTGSRVAPVSAPAPPSTPLPPADTPAKRGPRVVAIVLAVVAGVLLGAGLWVRAVYDPTPAPHRVVVSVPRGSSRVTVRLDRFPGSPPPSGDLLEVGRWVEREPGTVTLAKGPGRVAYEGSVDRTVTLHFATGPRAGTARTVVDGAAERPISLRAATRGERVQRLHFAERVPVTAWLLLVLMMGVAVVLTGAAAWVLLQLARRRSVALAVVLGAVALVAGVLTGVLVRSQPPALARGSLDGVDHLLRAGNRLGVALLLAVLVVLAGGLALGVRPPAITPAGPERPRDRWTLTLALGAVPFVGYLALHLLFWPGLMNPDAVVQWFELDRTGLDNWHPYLFAVGLGGLRHIVDSPALPILLQSIGTSLLVGRIAAWTVWRGRSVWVAGATLLLLPVLPATGLFTVTLWKDTAFAIALLALALVIWRIEDTDGAWLGHPANVALTSATLAAVWLTRHNGWPIVVGTIVVVVLAHRARWRPIGVAVGATLLLVLVVEIPLASALDVRANRQPAILYVQHIANQINSGTHLTADERATLSKIYPLDRRWPYDCHSIQATWSGPGAIPLQRFTSKSSELRTIALDLALRNPGAELDHLACSSELLWKPSAPDGQTYFLEWSSTAGHVDYIPRFYDDTPSENPSSPRAIARIYDVVTGTLPIWVLRPALYLYALLAAVAWAAWRRRSWGVVRIAVPAILQTIILIPVTLVQDVRLQYGVILTAVVLVPFLLTVSARRDADDRVPLRWGSAARGDREPG